MNIGEIAMGKLSAGKYLGGGDGGGFIFFLKYINKQNQK